MSHLVPSGTHMSEPSIHAFQQPYREQSQLHQEVKVSPNEVECDIAGGKQATIFTLLRLVIICFFPTSATPYSSVVATLSESNIECQPQ